MAEAPIDLEVALSQFLSSKEGHEQIARKAFLHHHSLSLVSGVILLVWIVLYIRSDPRHPSGSFFGNAIADWTGLSSPLSPRNISSKSDPPKAAGRPIIG